MTQVSSPGRAGVLFESVAEVADRMAAAGERPTLRAIRAALGTGSLGTIQKHLSAWQGARRQVVAESQALPSEIQRVVLAEISRSVSTARAELEADLVAAKNDRDMLAEDNEAQVADLDAQAVRIAEIEALRQQQAGRLAQLEADLIGERQAVAREREVAEQARQSLARAELRLEALPRLEAEADRLRVSLAAEQQRATVAEQVSAVAAERLAGLEARLSDLAAREAQTVAQLAQVTADAQKATVAADAVRIESLQAQMSAQAAASAADARALNSEHTAEVALKASSTAALEIDALKTKAAGLQAQLDALNRKLAKSPTA